MAHPGCGESVVAHALDHGNPRQAISTHVEEGDRAYLKDLGRPSDGRPLKHNDGLQIFISESGLYSLILGSQKAEAKVFQRWITNEVLPSIRKAGHYTLYTGADMSKKRAELEIAEIDTRTQTCKRQCLELRSMQRLCSSRHCLLQL